MEVRACGNDESSSTRAIFVDKSLMVLNLTNKQHTVNADDSTKSDNCENKLSLNRVVEFSAKHQSILR